jgi:predicted O-methyltransferase YrrM
MRQLGIGGNVDLIVGDSQRRQYDHIGKFDVLFIDGDHSYEGCSRDLENWWPKLVTGGQLLLHDCYFGSPVQPAVLDFMAAHEVEVVQSPYIGASHWHYPTGSVAHLIKRG